MSLTKVILSLAVILISVLAGYFIGQNTKTTSAQIGSQTIEKSKNYDLLVKLKEEKIRKIQVWNSEDDRTFYGIIREVDEPPYDGSTFKTSDKLSIFDEFGKAVYELKDLGIGGIEFARLLKSDSLEVMVETNGGGTDSFLKILSYKDGKFTEIIDESETQFRGGYFTMLQYRSGMEGAYFKPSQLIVVGQVGGTDTNPTASVFRAKYNKLQKVGEIKMQELGDFIENQISKKK